MLRNSTITVHNFWKSLEMPLINCKLELKLKCTRHCVLVSTGTESADANSDNIFLLSKTQSYMSLSSLYQLKSIKNCQNFLAKDLKDKCTGANIKQKVRSKNKANEYRYFLESNFVA